MQKYGIRVSTICPGFVRTPLTAENPYKMPFIMEPEDFAREAVEAITARDRYRVILGNGGACQNYALRNRTLVGQILANRKQKPRTTAQ